MLGPKLSPSELHLIGQSQQSIKTPSESRASSGWREIKICDKGRHRNEPEQPVSLAIVQSFGIASNTIADRLTTHVLPKQPTFCLPQPAGKRCLVDLCSHRNKPVQPVGLVFVRSFGIASNTIADRLTTHELPKQAPNSPRLLATTCWQALPRRFVQPSKEAQATRGFSSCSKLWHCKQHHRRSPNNPRVAQAGHVC